MGKRKDLEKLKQSYGVKPDIQYYVGDIGGIRTYFDYRDESGLDEFLIDDTTWFDLSGTDIYKRINSSLSLSGEQVLYYHLRSPAVDKEEYEKRSKLIEMMENDPRLRLKLQYILLKLGKRRDINPNEVFKPPSHSPKKLAFYLLLLVVMIGSALSLFFTQVLFPLLIAVVVFNFVYHHLAAVKMRVGLATAFYSVSMIVAIKKIKKVASPELNTYLTSCYDSMKKLKPVLRASFVPTAENMGAIAELLNSFLLLDLIAFEILKNKLGKHHKEIFHIHEQLGRIDSAISVASYRKSLKVYTTPHIDFSASGDIRLYGEQLMHPLVNDAVPNSIDTEKPILLTGSNASGKSTFIRVMVLNAIFAQGICTVIGRKYVAPAFRIYTSMAIADDLLAEESYFIAEIKSLKRIIDADTSKQPILCGIDEVLRGTNTVERIAASSELLKHISSEKNILCIVATHDIELCDLLSEHYRMMHFTESITDDGDVVFDYKIRNGPSTTRNAIKLLERMGFDEEIVKRANEVADTLMAERNSAI